MRLNLSICCLTWGALATGCAAVNTQPMPREVPAAFENSATTQPARWPAQEWYRDFSSDELNGFVDLAVKDNSDLAVARARVAQADARARQAGSALLPSIDAAGNANYLAGHSSQGGGHELDWSGMLTASYEVDFWGKNRATAESARYLAGASRAQRDTVALTTLAGVADAYFQVLALRERLTVAQSNGDAARQLLAVVQSRFDAGAASPVEVASQQTAFDSAQIAVTELQQAEGEARAALALLLGRAPENFMVAGQALDSLSEPQVAAGLPSELLTRRPDIVLAEANLRAGHADLAAARAAMFPSLSLTAAAGVQNPALPATVLTIPGAGPSFALGANLIQPIFDHGRLKAQRDEAQAKDMELLLAYRAAIIAALIDVENALSAIQHLDAARDFQVANIAHSERAFEGAKLRYQAGSGDFLTLLEAQRTLYAARDQFIRYKLARLQSLVSLCKALGGGWTQPVPQGVTAKSMQRNMHQ
ncbi:MAG TPA: efflux transporter outer membrane subunit [Steroidobacteraceae bacterium]|nr:efflux transporter outer membrane subunit [Steroidobacteraceae bacterium]